MGRGTTPGTGHFQGPVTARVLAANPLRRGLLFGSGDVSTTAHVWVDNTVSDTVGILIPFAAPFLELEWSVWDRTLEGEWWVGSSQPTILNVWWLETLAVDAYLEDTHEYGNTHSGSNFGSSRLRAAVGKPKPQGRDYIFVGGGGLFDFIRQNRNFGRRY